MYFVKPGRKSEKPGKNLKTWKKFTKPGKNFEKTSGNPVYSEDIKHRK